MIKTFSNHTQRDEAMYILAPIVEGLYDVASISGTTVTVKIRSSIERVSRDRVHMSPEYSTGTPHLVHDASQSHSWNNPSPPIAGSEPNIAPPETENKYPAWEIYFTHHRSRGSQ